MFNRQCQPVQKSWFVPAGRCKVIGGIFQKKLNTIIMGQRIKRDPPCELTEEEKAETANKLALNVAEYNEVEEDKKAVVQNYNERLKLLRTLQTKWAKEVETGLEERPVVCEWDYHSPERGQKRLIRQDTFEVVEVQRMTEYDEEAYAAEMQPTLFENQ